MVTLHDTFFVDAQEDNLDLASLQSVPTPPPPPIFQVYLRRQKRSDIYPTLTWSPFELGEEAPPLLPSVDIPNTPMYPSSVSLSCCYLHIV